MVSWIGLMKVAGVVLVMVLIAALAYFNNICLGIFVGLFGLAVVFGAVKYFEAEFQTDKP